MIRFEQVTKTFGPRFILKEADLLLNPGERAGLIGANGVGKTTLMRMILGDIEPDGGAIHLMGRPRIGWLRQELTSVEGSLLQVTLEGHDELVRLRRERETLRHQVETNPEAAAANGAITRLGETECRLESLGTYDAEARAGTILRGLGFAPEEMERPVSAFSGGWRMRLALAQALFAAPDLLLLDEPTNHLDLESVAWLTGFLTQWRGALLVISHQRAFLNRVVQATIELEDGRLTRYAGNFDDYLEEKALRLEQEQNAALQQGKRVEELTRFIERFRAKATKARQVQSRIKMLEKMDRVEVSASSRAGPVMRLPEPLPCHRQVLTLDEVGHAYDESPLFSTISHGLQRGEKVGLLGVNGAGKSTLLKLCAGLFPPTTGRVRLGERVKPVYFAQHALEALQPEHTVLASLEQAAAGGVTQARGLLGGFLFSGDDVFKKVAVLSGGERARLALARLFVSGANFLLLDEPTNHLDMAARAALAEALESYSGTLLLVSHDRELLESACDSYWLVGRGGVTPWEGELDAYLAESTARRAPPAAAPAPASRRKENRRLAATLREGLSRETRALRQQCTRLEERIHRLERELGEVDQVLADPGLYAAGQEGAREGALQRHRELAAELETVMGQWEAVGSDIEARELRVRAEIAELEG